MIPPREYSLIFAIYSMNLAIIAQVGSRGRT